MSRDSKTEKLESNVINEREDLDVKVSNAERPKSQQHVIEDDRIAR